MKKEEESHSEDSNKKKKMTRTLALLILISLRLQWLPYGNDILRWHGVKCTMNMSTIQQE
jgi:hypothetical protein